MTMNFIGRTTSAGQLKASLDLSAQRTRAIADRVARASAGALSGGPASQPVFSLAGERGDAVTLGEGSVDIESEMVSLADEQLRYEAAAKLLEKTYAGLRAALQER